MVERQRSYSAAITAVERYLPEKVLTNLDLEKLVDTSDSWIRERTGIAERRICTEGPTSLMAVAVARKLLASRGLDPGEIDLIIVSTVTPDMIFPSTACLVQDQIGAHRAWGYDLLAACSGFVYALVAGAQFIESGAHRRVLVLGADKMSTIVDWRDRSTCVLFGDGAGGVLLERAEDTRMGLLDFECRVDGSGAGHLHMKAGGSLQPATRESVEQGLHYVYQEGRPVYKFAVVKMAEVSLRLLEKNGLGAEDLALFVPHQANRRIIEASALRLGLPPEKVMINIDRYANTTTASIPIALSEALEEGRLECGDLMMMTAVGGGLSWGSALFRWGEVG